MLVYEVPFKTYSQSSVNATLLTTLTLTPNVTASQPHTNKHKQTTHAQTYQVVQSDLHLFGVWVRRVKYPFTNSHTFKRGI